ncbi:MAG TPA: hypothetical protein DCL80_09625 [Balneola sp.]|jgi:hypothetical protein|nr:hypothetical protein [Flavobacteriaceae bacterium]MAO77543.1 hypothetical protein [Balneola sp.]MBF63850.1 hypothetical protein [Balneola sp.]HAH51496.1 hypothetical protein [Balneola sp.]|tara:strand:+ start:2701 stop:3579 length:879 start_codon:yes stop_codon:yes gene_type:complete
MKIFTKTLLLTAITFFTANSLQAQTIVVPDTLNGWTQTWVANLNGSQATYSNWSEGGVNTVSGTASTVYTKMYRKEQHTFGFRTNLRYGQSKVAGDTRKSDDLISIRLRTTYDLQEDSKIAAYGAIQFRTQFADGYDYEAKMNPAGGDSLISGFFSPAYLTEGAGLEYNANPSLQIEAGLALKQTFISDGDLSPNYGLSQGDTFRSEGGLTTGISFQTTVAENIQYSSNLETFTSFTDPVSETDVFWANELVGQINSIISASFQFEMRYDDDFSSEVQIKQVLSAGISVNLY